MSWTGWIAVILIVQVVHFAGTWKLYVAAGRKAWEAAVPVYNAVVLMKIINRPWWWVFLLFIPVVHLIMFPVIWVETLRSYGRNSAKETFLVIVTFGFYLYFINYTQEVKYVEDRSLIPRTSAGEWTSSILFAIVAATIVHNYFMQPFTIPTSSLEKTLLVGDYLFVSKFHYGAKAPMTTASLPMVHDTVPVLNSKSYYKGLQYPYVRIPGFQKIKRNDIVVFGWPVDTLTNITDPSSAVDIKPMDKKSNYVKRAVGVPGDSLEVRDGYVFINGKPNDLPDRAKLQFGYQFRTTVGLNPKFMAERYNITDLYRMENKSWRDTRIFAAHMTNQELEKFKNFPSLDTIIQVTSERGQRDPGIFPHDPQYAFNANQFGPIYIPEAGKTVDINSETIAFYKRIIEVYEGRELGLENKITQSGTQVLLNGNPLTSYTFKQDYYWMMGDNRNNSQDARMWGYVPFNHVVGKPVMVWLSMDPNKGLFNGKIRWDRMFTTVGGSGQPVSYFKYVLIAIIGWFGFNYYRKRKKAKK